MSNRSTGSATATVPSQDGYEIGGFVIERRDIVGRIEFDPLGEKHPIDAAMEVCAKYLAENAGGRTPIMLSFEPMPGFGTFAVSWRPPAHDEDGD